MTEQQTQTMTAALRTLLNVLPPELDLVLKASDDNDVVLTAEPRQIDRGPLGPLDAVDFNVSDGPPGSRSHTASFDSLDDALSYFERVETAGGFGAIWEADRRAKATGTQAELVAHLHGLRANNNARIPALTTLVTPAGRTPLAPQVWERDGQTLVAYRVPKDDAGRIAKQLADRSAVARVTVDGKMVMPS